MNENAKAWVAALRSGEYKQGRGSLCSKGTEEMDKYCCLGVACELAVKAGVLHSYWNTSLATKQYDGESNYLPKSVSAWLGLKSTDGELPRTELHVHRSLATMNDSGLSFLDIAGLIEKQEEYLFMQNK